MQATRHGFRWLLVSHASNSTASVTGQVTSTVTLKNLRKPVSYGEYSIKIILRPAIFSHGISDFKKKMFKVIVIDSSDFSVVTII